MSCCSSTAALTPSCATLGSAYYTLFHPHDTLFKNEISRSYMENTSIQNPKHIRSLQPLKYTPEATFLLNLKPISKLQKALHLAISNPCKHGWRGRGWGRGRQGKGQCQGWGRGWRGCPRTSISDCIGTILDWPSHQLWPDYEGSWAAGPTSRALNSGIHNEDFPTGKQVWPPVSSLYSTQIMFTDYTTSC